MPLREKLNDDIKNAMKAREQDKLAALRLMLAAVKQREVDERITLDDAGVIAVVEKMVKQRKDSIAQYEKAARQDLADKEKYEISVIEAYLPQQMSQQEIEAAVAEGLLAPRDPKRDAGMVAELCQATFHRYAFASTDQSVEQIAEGLWQFCFAALGGQPPVKATDARKPARRTAH